MTQLTNGYDPRYDFKVDLAYGKAGEAELVEFFNAVQEWQNGCGDSAEARSWLLEGLWH
jgi:hypothetical protein